MTAFYLDTNVFINSWRLWYPPDIFAPLWRALDEAIEQGIALAPREVLEELEKKDDELHGWVSARKAKLIEEPTTAVLAEVRSLMTHDRHKRLVDSKRGRSMADPWVIAHAKAAGGVVVTYEQRQTNPGKSPKIPDVCDGVGVTCMTPVRFMRAIGFRLP